MRFHENPSSGSHVVPMRTGRQTVMRKLIFAFPIIRTRPLAWIVLLLCLLMGTIAQYSKYEVSCQ